VNVLTVKREEAKKRRSDKKSRLAPVRQPDIDRESAATRFARQGLREPQIQTALDPVLLVFAVL
jgi:hypothetical protein